MTGVRADLEWGTTPRLLRSSAERFGDAVAVAEGTTSLSFTDLLAASNRVAASLLALGVAPGDRVAIWAPNVWEWIPVALGLQTVGAVLVPLNTRYKGREAAYILGRSRARVLVTVAGFLGNDYVGLLRDAVDVAEELPDLEATVVLRADVAPPGTLGWTEFLGRGDAIDPAEVETRALAVEPEDLSDLLFTSGTTGNPKGVMQTHAATLRAFWTWGDVVGLRAGDRYLVVNPFFHAFGYKAGWLVCLMTGATVIPQGRDGSCAS
jgi:acyl-CoA synthetase (AMP-forming)/AMP-acid ligase II